MEELLLRVGSQAANFAIRSGLGYASKFAFVQVSKFIQNAPDGSTAELEKMRRRLENKIKIVTPAIDLIERIAARGNTSLASTVQLTTALRHDINEFGKRVNELAESHNNTSSTIMNGKTEGQNIRVVLDYMRDLLRRIEDAVPLISLALTTSGANLSSSLPDTVSPSRLLQASSLLRTADDTYDLTHQPVQVGPSFLVKFYSIFTSHSRVNSVKDIQWKEEFAKCRATIVRIPSRAHKEIERGSTSALPNGSVGISAGYEYELRLLEDLDDGRYHEKLENWSRKRTKDEIASKGYIEGRVRHIPVHKIARLFYEHAGILLNLGESLSPVLIAKVQHGAPHPQNVLERFTNPGDDSDEETFGPDLASGFSSDEEEEMDANKGARMGDIEWVAFEIFEEEDESDDEDDDWNDEDATEELLPAMSALTLRNSSPGSSPPLPTNIPGQEHRQFPLSLMEYILRLAALQTFEQQSHMNLTDEHIVLFLRDDNPGSRQQPTLEQERTLRRRSSLTSIASLTSDFSSRELPRLPMSPPRSDKVDPPRNLDTNDQPSSFSSSPVLSKKPATKNPRTQLERAMAADYDPMTLMTPMSNRRVTRNGLRKVKLMRKSQKQNSNSAPNSLQRSSAGQNAEGNEERSPLTARVGGRRTVSASVATRGSKGRVV